MITHYRQWRISGVFSRYSDVVFWQLFKIRRGSRLYRDVTGVSIEAERGTWQRNVRWRQIWGATDLYYMMFYNIIFFFFAFFCQTIFDACMPWSYFVHFERRFFRSERCELCRRNSYFHLTFSKLWKFPFYICAQGSKISCTYVWNTMFAKFSLQILCIR